MLFYFHDLYTLFLIFAGIFFSFLAFIDKNRIPLLMQFYINQKYAVIYHRNEKFIFNCRNYH